MKENIIQSKSYEFALSVIQLCRKLEAEREFVISRQLMRSGTSVGANIREATNANTKRDFIYKMNISQKECAESMYWLDLLKDSKTIKEDQFTILNHQATEILKILIKIITTSKNNLNNQGKV